MDTTFCCTQCWKYKSIASKIAEGKHARDICLTCYEKLQKNINPNKPIFNRLTYQHFKNGQYRARAKAYKNMNSSFYKYLDSLD